MDLFLTEDDYLPAEFDELPLDEAILRVRELEDERPSTSRQKKSTDGNQTKRKRPRDDDDDDQSDRSNDTQYSDGGDDDDGWLVNDLGDDYRDEDDEEGNKGTVKDGVKRFGADQAEEEIAGGRKDKQKKKDEGDEEKEKKPRRRINTQPRVLLNPTRLRDPKALAALENIQASLVFKGKGHEEEDLSTIMQAMENWAHRLMPKMKFDDFIKKIEQLGRKKVIKAYVNNIRHDLPAGGFNDVNFDEFTEDLNIGDLIVDGASIDGGNFDEEMASLNREPEFSIYDNPDS